MVQPEERPRVYLQNPDVVIREVDEEGALLFNPDTNHIRVLNRTGLFLWNLCEKGSDLSTMVAGLQEAFDQVPEGEVAGQVEGYLADLIEAGFLGQEGGAPMPSEHEVKAP